MCKINTITIDGPNADEFRDVIAAALAKHKNTLAFRDEHAQGTLEAVAAPLRVAVIKTDTPPTNILKTTTNTEAQ